MEVLPIKPSGSASISEFGSHLKPGQKPSASEFKEMFEKYLKDVNELQLEADKSVKDLATGKAENLHQLITVITEADLSFRLMMQVRNKLVEAYREIMRMQV